MGYPKPSPNPNPNPNRDLPWLLAHTRLPILAKGILHPDDAVLAARAGCKVRRWEAEPPNPNPKPKSNPNPNPNPNPDPDDAVLAAIDHL